MYNYLKGIIAYAVTPFTQGGHSIDLEALPQLTNHLLSTRPSAISFLGSTGESAYLSEEEWQAVSFHGVQQVAKQIPVIIGIGELTTTAAIRKAQYAEQIGADAIMVIPLSYWKLTDNEVFDYFAAIAEKTCLPIMAYNNPHTSGLDMSPALLLRLVREIDNITMIKESSGDIQRMHSLYYQSQGDIPFYNGCNILALEALAAGAQGWCTAAPNLLNTQPADLYEEMATGHLFRSRELFYSMLPLLRFMGDKGLATTVKAGLSLKGLNAGDPRLPLKALTGEPLNELKQSMDACRVTVKI